MFAIPVTRESRPVAVLLGGSGYARPPLRMPTVPALLKPRPNRPRTVWLRFRVPCVGA
jgi:hypothetical protein